MLTTKKIALLLTLLLGASSFANDPATARIHAPILIPNANGSKLKPYVAKKGSKTEILIRLFHDADAMQPVYGADGQAWQETLTVIAGSNAQSVKCTPASGLYIDGAPIDGEYDLILGASKPLPEEATYKLLYFTLQVTEFANPNSLIGTQYPPSQAMVLGIGSKGPKGDDGEPGPQGIKGDTGPQGPQGIKGDTGPQGPQGIKGDTGPQGVKGDTGTVGPKGDKGDTGATGPAGPSTTPVIEVRSPGGTPHIDFSIKDQVAQDFSVRMIALVNNKLWLESESGPEKRPYIGWAKDAGYSVDTDGNIRAQKFIETSDERLKSDIAPLGDALSRIAAIRGYSYRFHDLAHSDPGDQSVAGRDIGFLAQELEKVVPEAVFKDSNGQYSVRYTALVPVLVEAMKEQTARHDSVMKVVAELMNAQDQRIVELEARLLALEKKN